MITQRNLNLIYHKLALSRRLSTTKTYNSSEKPINSKKNC